MPSHVLCSILIFNFNLSPSMGGKFALFLFDIFLTLKHYNIGPYYDLYYIFASSKRPMRIWKRPIVFSMIYHQYQKRKKKYRSFKQRICILIYVN
jgi:hypothetical protein